MTKKPGRGTWSGVELPPQDIRSHEKAGGAGKAGPTGQDQLTSSSTTPPEWGHAEQKFAPKKTSSRSNAELSGVTGSNAESSGVTGSNAELTGVTWSTVELSGVNGSNAKLLGVMRSYWE